MDTQLIGIELAQLVLKHHAPTQKQRPARAAKPAAESMAEEEPRTESR